MLITTLLTSCRASLGDHPRTDGESVVYTHNGMCKELEATTLNEISRSRKDSTMLSHMWNLGRYDNKSGLFFLKKESRIRESDRVRV